MSPALGQDKWWLLTPHMCSLSYASSSVLFLFIYLALCSFINQKLGKKKKVFLSCVAIWQKTRGYSSKRSLNIFFKSRWKFLPERKTISDCLSPNWTSEGLPTPYLQITEPWPTKMEKRKFLHVKWKIRGCRQDCVNRVFLAIGEFLESSFKAWFFAQGPRMCILGPLLPRGLLTSF